MLHSEDPKKEWTTEWKKERKGNEKYYNDDLTNEKATHISITIQ